MYSFIFGKVTFCNRIDYVVSYLLKRGKFDFLFMPERFDSQPRHHGIVQNIQDPDMRQWVDDFLGAFELDVHKAQDLRSLQEIYNHYLNQLSFSSDDFLTQQVLTCMNYYFALRKKSFSTQVPENLQSGIGGLVNNALEKKPSQPLYVATNSHPQNHQGQAVQHPFVAETKEQHRLALDGKSDYTFSFSLRMRHLLVAGIVLALALSGRYLYQRSFQTAPDTGTQIR